MKSSQMRKRSKEKAQQKRKRFILYKTQDRMRQIKPTNDKGYIVSEKGGIMCLVLSCVLKRIRGRFLTHNIFHA